MWSLCDPFPYWVPDSIFSLLIDGGLSRLAVGCLYFDSMSGRCVTLFLPKLSILIRSFFFVENGLSQLAVGCLYFDSMGAGVRCILCT